MSLDFINKDLFSSDPLAKLSRKELDALEEKLVRDLETAIDQNARDMLPFEECQRVMRPFIDRQVAARREIHKREARLRSSRGAFWIVLFFAAFALFLFALWIFKRLSVS